MKKLITILVVTALLVWSAPVLAKDNTTFVYNSKSEKVMYIPENAVEVVPDVFWVPMTLDEASNQMVEGYIVIHRKNNGKKPDHAGGPGNGGNNGGNGGSDVGSSCYAFMAKDAKWKIIEPWVMNSANTDIDGNLAFNIMENGVAKWENAASGALDLNSIDIIGEGSLTNSVLVADESSPDGINEVYFGEISDSNVIGITIVWGIFGGPPRGRELVEWDQVYNTNFNWATDGNLNAMDFESIATHELGHTFGLADLYQSECSNQTMYGYGSNGEIYARSLEAGDIAGISKLY